MQVEGVLVSPLLAPTGLVVEVGQLIELGHLVMMTPAIDDPPKRNGEGGAGIYRRLGGFTAT